MAVSETDLLKGLAEDVSKAREVVGSSRAGKGVSEREPELGFDPKAIRFQGKVIGQKQLAQSRNLLNKAIDHLASERQFLNQDERTKFKTEIQKRAREFQFKMFKQGLEIEKNLFKKKISGEQAQQQRQLFGSLVENAITAGFLAVPSGKVQQPGSKRFGGIGEPSAEGLRELDEFSNIPSGPGIKIGAE